jgi:hypothetical protein
VADSRPRVPAAVEWRIAEGQDVFNSAFGGHASTTPKLRLIMSAIDIDEAPRYIPGIDEIDENDYEPSVSDYDPRDVGTEMLVEVLLGLQSAW